MLTLLPVIVQTATTLLTVAGLVYLTLCLLAVRSFSKQPVPPPAALPPTISVLKPVKGFDPGLAEACRSHCQQNYTGRFELLLGAADSSQLPALQTMIHALQTEFPAIPVRVVHCPQRLGTSGKVSTLVQLLPHALGEVLVFNDADIQVAPTYLATLAAWLQDPAIGLVTAPYFAQVAPGGGLWSRLEALGISTAFLPSILTARMMEEGLRFGLGSTLALHRSTLARIGGLQPLLEHLADDYEIGARVAALPLRVVLAQQVVATSVPHYTLSAYVEHQTRWARTVRDARRWGYLGIVTTFALPWALATVVSSGVALWSLSLLSLAILLRVAVALTSGVGLLRDGQVLRDLALLPLLDFFSLFFWLWSFAGNSITWRGERFHVQDGILVSTAQGTSQHPIPKP